MHLSQGLDVEQLVHHVEHAESKRLGQRRRHDRLKLLLDANVLLLCGGTRSEQVAVAALDVVQLRLETRSHTRQDALSALDKVCPRNALRVHAAKHPHERGHQLVHATARKQHDGRHRVQTSRSHSRDRRRQSCRKSRQLQGKADAHQILK